MRWLLAPERTRYQYHCRGADDARAHEVAEASRNLKETNAELANLYARAKELDDSRVNSSPTSATNFAPR